MVGTSQRHVRRKARRILLQVLFEVDASGHDLEDTIDWVCHQTHLGKKSTAFIREVAHQVVANHELLDEEIQRYAPSWPVFQLALVDRNILRIAICEMKLSKEVTPQIAINEAVELAKHFGEESSPRFVNGVLGAVAGAMA